MGLVEEREGRKVFLRCRASNIFLRLLSLSPKGFAFRVSLFSFLSPALFVSNGDSRFEESVVHSVSKT